MPGSDVTLRRHRSPASRDCHGHSWRHCAPVPAGGGCPWSEDPVSQPASGAPIPVALIAEGSTASHREVTESGQSVSRTRTGTAIFPVMSPARSASLIKHFTREPEERMWMAMVRFLISLISSKAPDAPAYGENVDSRHGTALPLGRRESPWPTSRKVTVSLSGTYSVAVAVMATAISRRGKKSQHRIIADTVIVGAERQGFRSRNPCLMPFLTHAAGRVKKKVEPSPGVDSTRTCRRAVPRSSGRRRGRSPFPRTRRGYGAAGRSRRSGRSTRPRSRSRCRPPKSATNSPERSAEIRTSGGTSGRRYLIEFETRFVKTWASWAASAITTGMVADSDRRAGFPDRRLQQPERVGHDLPGVRRLERFRRQSRPARAGAGP